MSRMAGISLPGKYRDETSATVRKVADTVRLNGEYIFSVGETDYDRRSARGIDIAQIGPHFGFHYSPETFPWELEIRDLKFTARSSLVGNES